MLIQQWVLHQNKLSSLISKIVIGWDPENPIESLLELASSGAGCTKEELRKAIEETKDSPFGGDALSSFFNWNPFSKYPIDKDYEMYCLTKFEGKTKQEVKQLWKDKETVEKLENGISEKLRKTNGYGYVNCKYLRNTEGIKFMISTSYELPFSGWQDKKVIEAFIKAK